MTRPSSKKIRSAAITVAAALGIGLGSYGIAAAQTDPAPSDPAPSDPAPSDPTSPDLTQTDPAGENEVDGEHDDQNENQDAVDPARAAEAVVSQAEAEAAALAEAGGGAVANIELEDEAGVLAYEVEILTDAGAEVDVTIDAMDGSATIEPAEADEADEADEAAEADEVDGIEHENEHEGENDPDASHED